MTDGIVLNGSSVVAWEDQTSNNNILAAVGAPSFVSGAINGLGAVHFDGVDDALTRAVTTGLPLGPADRSVFMMVKYNAANANGTGLAGFAYGKASSNQTFGLALTSTGLLAVQGWGSGNDFVSNPATPGVGQWLVQGAVLSGGTLSQYKDGGAIGTAQHAYATGAGSIRLGEELNGGKNLNMDVAEVLVYNRALTTTELQQIQGYFETRYGLTAGNTAPVVSITAPANGTSVVEGTAVTFTGTASDTQDGNLTTALTWTSNRDGALGTGGSLSRTLSVGTHTITAAVTDSGGLTGSATRTVTVTSATPSNTAPVVSITAPANGTSVVEGTAVTFTGTASDTQDGNLTAALTWTSNRDGALGTGGSLSRTLSVGTHTITAAVTDSGGLTGSATRSVTVTSSGGPGQLILTGLVTQLESDLNVALQAGTTVAGWLDQSGLGNDLIASGNPQLVAAATPAGQPAISLDGVGDKLERLHATAPLGGLPTGNANRTMFLVARYHTSPVWAGAVYGRGASNQAFGLTVSRPSGLLALHGYGSANDRASTSAGVGAGWLVQSAVLNNGTATLFKNGVALTQWAHVYNTVLTKLVIGEEIKNAGFINMDVAAVLIYDRALTDQERASVDAYLANKYLQPASGNTAPVVSITAPANGTSVVEGTAVTFTGTASDTQDGNLTTALTWTSNRDGALGTGGSLSRTLSVGTHTITAAVTDSGGLTGSATRTVTVTSATPSNTAPVVSITAPANGTSVVEGTAVTFTGTASDTQDGNLTAALAWTSDRDGALGTGGSLSRTLSVGTHTITAAVTDSGGLTGSATRSVTVTSSGGPGQLILTGLVTQLESDLNVALQAGTTVAGWLDQSGLGNDLIASGNPQLVAAATPAGQPAISLDGVGDKLERLHATAPLGGLPTGNANRTMFLVARYTRHRCGLARSTVGGQAIKPLG